MSSPETSSELKSNFSMRGPHLLHRWRRKLSAMAFGLRGFTMLVVAVVLSGCRHGVLDPQGPVGESERLILFDATAVMLAVVVPVILATLAFAWWFSEKNPRAGRRPSWEYSGRIEFVTWSIPALFVLFLSGIAWIGSHDLDPPKPMAGRLRPVEIQVVSLDWKWVFIYPRGEVASLNELVIPVNTPVHFQLTSGSVMNSFFVPQLGSQIYTMAGMRTELNLLASHPGIYQGISAQFSGDGFSDMRFQVHAVSLDDFRSWLENTRENSARLDESEFQRLLRPSRADPPAVYGKVSAGLFEAILEHPGAAPSASTARTLD